MCGNFLECDKQFYSELVLLFYYFVYHILDCCQTSKNLRIIENFACKSESG